MAGSLVVTDARAYALGPDEGRKIDFGDGFDVTVKADEHATGGVVSVLETEEPPGLGPPMHIHHDCAEAFYVLEGEYVMDLEEREVVCQPAHSSSFRRARGTASVPATCQAAS